MAAPPKNSPNCPLVSLYKPGLDQLGAEIAEISKAEQQTSPANMNKFCLLLAFAAVALAKPHDHVESTIVEEGPWISADQWPAYVADRDGKGILDAPKSFLASLGNWWTWDR